MKVCDALRHDMTRHTSQRVPMRVHWSSCHGLFPGVHSGSASGIVPSSFRIMRQLLDRVEDSKTGELPKCFYGEVKRAHG